MSRVHDGADRSGPGITEQIRRAFLTHILRFPPGALPAPYFEYEGDAAEHYDESRKNRTVFNWEEHIVGELLKEAPTGTRVLDVPVGTGRFIPTYVRLGLEVVGLDFSRDMLDEAAQTLRVACGYRRDPAAPSHSVPHRLRDPGPALQMLQNGMPVVIRDVLAPDGSPVDGAAAEVLGYAVAPFRAHLAVPVMRQDRLASVMTIRFDTPHDWSSDELAIVHDASVRIW
jgi:GAF domain-containing protein